MNIWQKIIFSCLAVIVTLLIYQNDRINAEMEVVKERVANIHKMQIDSSYRQYVQDFINNDFDAIANHFAPPVDFKLYDLTAETNEDVINQNIKMKANIQQGYAYSLIDEIDILSSTGALSLSSVPKHLMVIGAGYIGLEMGSVWSRLGSKVTVIEYADRILPGMDQEISSAFQKILIKQGFDFKLSTALRDVSKVNGSLSVSVENNGQTLDIDCDKVLISTGRRPYTFGLNLEEIGVKLNDKGFIETNQHFKTSVQNIYAIGDCKIGPMLAHKASEEGTAVAEIIDGQAGHVNYNAIPSVIYTAPEVASVGKTEEELKDGGVSYKIGKFPFTANAKAKVMNDTSGFVKILSDTNTDEVLGVHIIGADAGNLIGELTIAMELSLIHI